MGNNIHIDKKLTDKGWKKMSVLLDEEMPVAVAKSRAGYWMALVVFLLFGALAAWILKDGGTTKNAKNIKKQPVQQSITSEKPMADAKTMPNSPQTTAKSKNQSVKSNENITPAPGRTGRAGLKSPASIAKTTADDWNVTDYYLPQANTKTVTTIVTGISPASSTMQPPVTRTQSTDESNLSATVLAPNEQLALLSIPEIEVSTDAERFPAITYDKKIVKKLLKKDKNTWGVYAGVHLEEFIGSDGWTIGIFKDLYVFKNKRWALSTGLFLAGLHKRKTVPILSSSKDDVAMYDSSHLPIESASNESYVNSVKMRNNTIDSYFQYLALPVSLKYHLPKRFYLRGGFEASLLLKTGFTNGENGEYLTSGAYHANTEGNERLPEIQSYDIALKAGVGYYITNRFDISLRYQHGLIDYYLVNEVADYHKKMGISARYYF